MLFSGAPLIATSRAVPLLAAIRFHSLSRAIAGAGSWAWSRCPMARWTISSDGVSSADAW